MVKFKIISIIPLAGFDRFQPGDFLPEEMFNALSGEMQREHVEIVHELKEIKKEVEKPIKIEKIK